MLGFRFVCISFSLTKIRRCNCNFVLLIVPRRHFCGGSFCFMSCVLNSLCCWRLMYVFIFFNEVKVTEWPPIGKIAAHSAYDMFHCISA